MQLTGSRFKDWMLFGMMAMVLLTQSASVFAAQNWKNLSKENQEFLFEMRAQWDKLPETDQKKWLKVAERYKTSPPEKQEKMRQRVAAWAQLTPEERRIARENFRALKAKQSEGRSANWESYQTLDEEQRVRLKDEQKLKRRQTQTNPTLPPGAAAYTR